MSKNRHSKLFLFSFVIVALLIIPFDSAYAATAPTLIATVTKAGGTEGGTTCTVDVNVTASTNFIVVSVNSDTAIVSVTDENSQTYTQRVANTAQTNKSYIYTTSNPTTNSANTITVTTGSGDIRCFATTFSGVYTTDPIGATGSGSGASGSPSTITYSTSYSNSYIIHVCGNENTGTYSWDANKVTEQSVSNGGANKFSGAVGSEATTTAGSNNATCTISATAVWSNAVIEVRGVPAPSYSLNNFDIYQSVSTTLDSGTAICTNVANGGTCGTQLDRGQTYRVEFQIDNIGDGSGSPNVAKMISSVGPPVNPTNLGEVWGSITATDVTTSGCSTNTNWTDSISGSTDVQIDSGTTCSISAGGNTEYWFIVTVGADANDDSTTFYVSDGTISYTSSVNTINIKTPAYNLNTLQVYKSASSTLDSGTLICTMSLTSDSDCTTALEKTSSYRFEILTNNTGDVTGSPISLQTVTSSNHPSGVVGNSSAYPSFTVAGALSSLNPGESQPRDLIVNSAQSKFWLAGANGRGSGLDSIQEFTCTTNLIASCSYVDSLDATRGSTENLIKSLSWNNNGTKLYVSGQTLTDVAEYGCTAYDSSTCTFTDALDVSVQGTTNHGIRWNNDGTKLYVSFESSKLIYEYACTAWDASTCTVTDSLDLSPQISSGSLAGITWYDNGKRLMAYRDILSTANDFVLDYRCTAYDVSTCVFKSSTSASGSGSGTTVSGGIYFDNGEFYIAVELLDLKQYNIGYLFGTITATDVTTSGCSTNTNWTDSISGSTDVKIDSGTTCSVSAGGNTEYWFIVTPNTLADGDRIKFSISDGSVFDSSTFAKLRITDAPAGGTTTYVVDLLDVFESESNTLESGMTICLNVDLENPSSCSGQLFTGHVYRFEIEIKNTGDTAGSPTSFDIDSSIDAFDLLGTVTTAYLVNSGCSTNTNWSESIVSTDARATSGTTCSITPSTPVEFWYVIRLDSDAGGAVNPTATFTTTDGSNSDTSTTTTFSVNNIIAD